MHGMLLMYATPFRGAEVFGGGDNYNEALACLTHHGRGSTMKSLRAAKVSSVWESVLNPLAGGQAA